MDPRLNFALEKLRRTLEAARRYGLDVSIVAVDASGHIIAAARRDLTSAASFEAARKKAFTAAAMKMPTAALTEMIANDPVSLRALQANPDLLAVPGGFPLVLDGVCIGGIGISGGAWHDDQMVGAEAMDHAGP